MLSTVPKQHRVELISLGFGTKDHGQRLWGFFGKLIVKSTFSSAYWNGTLPQLHGCSRRASFLELTPSAFILPISVENSGCLSSVSTELLPQSNTAELWQRSWPSPGRSHQSRHCLEWGLHCPQTVASLHRKVNKYHYSYLRKYLKWRRGGQRKGIFIFMIRKGSFPWERSVTI